MADRPIEFTVGDWTVHHTREPPVDTETIVLIHAAGTWSGGSLELAFHVPTGQWTTFSSLGPENSVPLTPADVVTEVLTRLGVEPERIDAEVFLAALAARYTPEHLLAAMRGSGCFR